MDEIPPDQPRPVFSIRPEHEPFFLPGNCSLLSVRPSPDLSASSSLQKSVVTHTDRSASVSEGDPHKLFSAVSGSPQPIESHNRERKSTRLNSSHVAITYAVIVLNKKKRGP